MFTLIVGVLIGALLASPLLPLLRITDASVGQAAAGIATVGVLLFTLQFYLSFRFGEGLDVDRFLAAVRASAQDELIAVALAALVAAVGAGTWQRA